MSNGMKCQDITFKEIPTIVVFCPCPLVTEEQCPSDTVTPYQQEVGHSPRECSLWQSSWWCQLCSQFCWHETLPWSHCIVMADTRQDVCSLEDGIISEKYSWKKLWMKTTLKTTLAMNLSTYLPALTQHQHNQKWKPTSRTIWSGQ